MFISAYLCHIVHNLEARMFLHLEEAIKYFHIVLFIIKIYTSANLLYFSSHQKLLGDIFYLGSCLLVDLSILLIWNLKPKYKRSIIKYSSGSSINNHAKCKCQREVFPPSALNVNPNPPTTMTFAQLLHLPCLWSSDSFLSSKKLIT